MSAKILDGAAISAQIRSEVALEVKALKEKGLIPGLAAILVGHNPASEIFVRIKMVTAAEIGIFSAKITPPETSTTEDMLAVVELLNARDDIDGILMQLPLPEQVDAEKVLLAINRAKDIDGLHPMNIGYLSIQLPCLRPCTPAGCIELLKRSGITIEGAEIVVLGRSGLVGKPLAMLLTNANATVTIAHSHTKNLAEVCRRADIIIVDIDKPGFLTPDMVRPGATVIDVGIHCIDDRATFDRFYKGNAKREAGFAKTGQTLIGDVDPRVAEVAGAITPVPGGVGPLNIAMLMSNTVKAAIMRRGGKYGL
jgi:methylenetetrahydrofolate dehydrogenase (NADP+)/methenyltetrahydrofolate cyclohydrolase